MKTCAFQKTYQNKCVLSFPEFEFQSGKIYAVIGSNGSGKSTFAKILSDVIITDHHVFPYIDYKPRVGYLPQKPYAFRMSLRKNLMINAEEHENDLKKHADSLMEKLDLMELADKKATTLSGGEAARMFLARLLMKKYDLIILDEPCAAMDIGSTLQAETLLRSYCEENNATIIIITHNLAQARRLAQEVLFFHEGKLIESGDTNTLLSNPTCRETRIFLDFLS